MNEAHIASRMTARHSPLFTLESGQSGLSIYTSQRDAALQLGQPLGLLGLHSAVLLFPAVVGGLGDLDGSANVGNGLALGDQLLSGFGLSG